MAEIKGSTLDIGKKMILKIYGEESFQRVVALLSQEEQAALTGPVWSSQWYPLDYYVHLSEAILKELYRGDEDAHLRELIYPSMEEQFNLIYRAFLSLGSPEALVGQMARITGTYFRGVSAQVQIVGPGEALVTYSGFGKGDRILEISFRGWWEKALEAMRVRSYSFEVKTSIGEGKGYGEYIVRWERR